MPVYLIPEHLHIFPHPETADANGIVGIGGDLDPDRLITAYAFGIFPWYNEGEPIIWWSPNPRFVLFPEKLKIHKSMRPYFNQEKMTVTMDHQFKEVINACQSIRRKKQSGTWITEEMKSAYLELHRLGYAHSVEVWKDGTLVGGLYGISLGKMFFGESMFAVLPNASKFGFIALVQKLKAKGYNLIDCQQQTDHLSSLGAELIPRKKFLQMLHANRLLPTFKGSWANW